MRTSQLSKLPHQTSPFELLDETRKPQHFFHPKPFQPLNQESQWPHYKSNWTDKEVVEALAESKANEAEPEAFILKERDSDKALYTAYVLSLIHI